MSKKVTFQELVNAISEQSGKPKQFTHDFIKDWVSVINESLKEDGNINIAGLGKFELRKMDEREGFNPQTEEKITIPAHNKIVFKPYKDLRDLVNAPYAHLESELIEDEDSEDQPSNKTKDRESEASTNDPLPPPVDPESEPEDVTGKKKAPWEQDMEKEIDMDEDDPFGLDKGRKSAFPLSAGEDDTDETSDLNEDDDVVAFVPGIDSEQDEEEEVTEADKDSDEKESINESFSGEGDSHKSKEAGKAVTPFDETEIETGSSKETDGSDIPIPDDQQSEHEPIPKKTPSFRDRRHKKRESEGNFWIIATAFLIVLLLIVGAWYYVGSWQTQSDTPETMTTQSVPDNGDSNSDSAIEQGSTPQADPNDPAASTPATANQPASTNQQQTANSQAASTPSSSTPSVKTVSVVEGQTLWGLADNNYDNPYLWPWIYDTNKSSIDDPDIIVIGQSLDIPLRSGTNNRLSENDSLQVALGYVETYRWYKENNLENARFYLYAAKKYHRRVFEYTDAKIDEADLTFANRAQ